MNHLEPRPRAADPLAVTNPTDEDSRAEAEPSRPGVRSICEIAGDPNVRPDYSRQDGIESVMVNPTSGRNALRKRDSPNIADLTFANGTSWNWPHILYRPGGCAPRAVAVALVAADHGMNHKSRCWDLEKACSARGVSAVGEKYGPGGGSYQAAAWH